jgi:general secretion pathway protein N
MRTDAAGLRTWWLVVFAGWALLICLMAGLGMGSRLPQAGGSEAARPLPAIPAAGAPRLGDLPAYAAIAQRPVFAEDRRPHPFVLAGTDAPQSTALRLTGVLITPQLQMATLTTDQGRSLRLRLQGEAVEGWRLLTLAARSATVEGPGGVRTLDMQVFDGHGGEAPTALRGKPGATPPLPAANAIVAPGVPMVPPPPPQAVAPAPTATANATHPSAPAATPPAPSEEQLKAIRERIEARRRALQQQQQPNPPRNGDGAVQQNP